MDKKYDWHVNIIKCKSENEYQSFLCGFFKNTYMKDNNLPINKKRHMILVQCNEKYVMVG